MKKKVTKKTVAPKKDKKRVTRVTSTEVVVRVENQPVAPTTAVFEPIKDGKKMTLTPTWINQAQLIKLVQKTPAESVYTRPGKGGQTWAYVTGSYVEKVLNFVFAWNWDFETVAVEEKYGQVIVRGKLTVKGPKGETISKMQTGRADIKFMTEMRNGKKVKTNIPLDYGNDEKAATTDCLKKCASLLGIASDIYGKQEYKQEAGIKVQEAPVVYGTRTFSDKMPLDVTDSQEVEDHEKIIGPDNKPTHVCAVCKDPISDQTAEYALKIYGKRLCREHQQGAKKK